jgi:mRNA interferase MazF
MPSTTSFERGDLVLVRFVFADEQGAKRRPVLVLSTGVYHAGRHDLIVAAVTSNVERLLPGDRTVREWRAAGLPKPSVVTGILRTIKVTMIESELGRLRTRDLHEVDAALRETLGL